MEETKGWELSVQVRPIDDLIEHEWTEDCVCGPTVEEREDYETMLIHHSLDGRENYEDE